MGSSYKGGGSPQFQSAFGDMATANEDSGMFPLKPKKQIDWEALMDGILQSAAIAQGGPTAALAFRKEPRRTLADELAEYEAKQRIAQKYEKPPSPYRFQDNAGNQMEVDPATGQVHPLYVDPAERVYFANGAMVKVPNPLRTTPPASTQLPQFSDDDWNNGQPMGGPAAAPRRPFVLPPRLGGGTNFPDPLGAPGRMTSGRRTVEGNRLVGGKPNSYHLSGDAADYVGTTPGELNRYFGGRARILNEGDHLHVTLPGYGRVPYYGRLGITGLRKR